MKKIHQMTNDELHTAYETASFIRNYLDDTASVKDLRNFISDIMNECKRTILDEDAYLKDKTDTQCPEVYYEDSVENRYIASTDDEIDEETELLNDITDLLREATYENNILKNQIQVLKQQLIGERKGYFSDDC